MKLETTKSWIERCLLEKNEVSNILTQKEVKEITHEVLLDLRSKFAHFVSAFNDLKTSFLQNTKGEDLTDQKEGLSFSFLKPIHIYQVSGKENGFMLFRKGHRLVFTPEKPGRIRIQLIKKENGILSNKIDTYINAFSNNIMSIQWTHEDHKGFVDLETLSRYYMKQFLAESEKSVN
ncbi:MAG: hypothetical protein ACR2M7_03280 [Bdellovibrionales bacterium]